MDLLYAVDGHVATVTINRPEARNALNDAVMEGLMDSMTRARADGDVRVVVLTGAGDKAFASGADISEFAARRTSAAARAEYDRGQVAFNRSLAELEKPVIAMIRGFCLGGGLLTALQADIRIASDDSQFGIPAARLGLGPAFASVMTLVDLVGPAWASEILFSARRFPAAEALRMGLVNRVVPATDLRGEVMSLARGIAQNVGRGEDAARNGVACRSAQVVGRNRKYLVYVLPDGIAEVHSGICRSIHTGRHADS